VIPRQPPAILRCIPWLRWNFSPDQEVLYLTFDDGPQPGVTEKVLEILKEYNAKGTFFCLGKNIIENTGLLKKIKAEGHSIGNHSYSHLNGWKTNTTVYISDIQKASALIPSFLYRPPYGKISPLQMIKLSRYYKIIMWDVLSYDYDKNISPEQCTKIILKNARKGSVVVFHDTLQAEKNCIYALKKTLEHFTKKGFSFKGIEDTQDSPFS
jgi:peptidoglycan-N-acetylglucosamine deacetylase